MAALEAMNGVACDNGGYAGTVSVAVAPNGAVSLLCTVTTPDGDGDGYLVPEDCDDANAAINPGAPELENGIDDNCNGMVDDGIVVEVSLTPMGQSFSPGSQHVFVLSNDGNGTATGIDIYLVDNFPEFFTIAGTDCGTTLAPGDSCTIAINYSPAPFTEDDAVLRVDGNFPFVQAQLFGN